MTFRDVTKGHLRSAEVIKGLILIFCHGMFLLIYRTGICHSLIDTDPDPTFIIQIRIHGSGSALMSKTD